MKYLLDEQEMAALVHKRELDDRNGAIEVLRRLVIPDDVCEKTKREAYCDKCPLSRAQNRNIDHAIARFLCSKPQSYSK